MWGGQTAPSWLRSEHTAWESERSRVTAGKKEGGTRGAEERSRGQEDHQGSGDIGKREGEAGLGGDKNNKEQRPRRRSEGDSRVKE